MRPFYSRRTYCSTLEKLCAQNLAACENQRMMKKITENHAKKTKRLTEIQVLTKDFTLENESNLVG